VEVYSQEDMDFVSEAIHLCIHESKGAWEGTYVYTDHTREEENNITDEMSALSVKAPYQMTPRQRKTFKKYSTPVKHANFRGGSRKYTPKAHLDLLEGVDPEILVRLGVEISKPSSNTVAGRELISKLIAVIKLDLDTIAQEKEEAKLREEGFWRFAGKTVKANMEHIRQKLDWATGQKKTSVDKGGPDLDEGSEEEFDEETSTEGPAFEIAAEPQKGFSGISSDEKKRLVAARRPFVAKEEVFMSNEELMEAFKTKTPQKADKPTKWATEDGRSAYVKSGGLKYV
jgi:hypothetical protein